MALTKLRGELPKDAIYLTEAEAIEHQWNLIWNWTPQIEIFPIRFGFMTAGLISSMAGLYLNNHYRRKLKLRSFGRLSSYIPVVVFPAFFTSMGHQMFVTNDILLQKSTCPLCVEMRALALQTFFGFAYPLILSPLAAFSNASNYLTYDIPSITQSPKKSLSLFWNLTKPISSKLSIIIAIQALAASSITYLEVNAVNKMQKELIRREKESLRLAEQ